MIGEDFSDYPMGAAWVAAPQTERDMYIRLALARLSPYGITVTTELDEVQMAAVASYVRFIFERDANNAPEPPAYLINALGVSRTNRPTSFVLVNDSSSSGSTSGLTQAEVDARVRAGVQDWAETGNADPIPAEKLVNAPSGGSGDGLDQGAVDARVRAGVQDWAETGNADPIPAEKLVNAPSGGSGDGLDQGAVDARVRAGVQDWAETGNGDTIPAAKLSEALAGVEDWAETGNADPIPADKLVNAPSGGSGDGLDQDAVDARVRAGVQDWAETGNGDTIPAAKLSEALAGVQDWAETGNADPIPADKLVNAPSSGSGDFFPDGARMTPSIAFDSDRNTGLYRAAENQISIAAGGQQVANFRESGIDLNQIVSLPAGSLIDGEPIVAGLTDEAFPRSISGIFYFTFGASGTPRRVELIGSTISFIGFSGNELFALRQNLRLQQIFSITDNNQGFVFRIDGPVSQLQDGVSFQYVTIDTVGNGNLQDGGTAAVNFLSPLLGVENWAYNGNDDRVPANKLPAVLDHRWVRVHRYNLSILDGLGGANAPNVQDAYESFGSAGRQAYLNWFRPDTNKDWFATIVDTTNGRHLASFSGVLDNTREATPNRETVTQLVDYNVVTGITDTSTELGSIFFEFRADGLIDQDNRIPILIGFPYLIGQQASPFGSDIRLDFYVRETIIGENDSVIEPWAVQNNALALPYNKLIEGAQPRVIDFTYNAGSGRRVVETLLTGATLDVGSSVAISLSGLPADAALPAINTHIFQGGAFRLATLTNGVMRRRTYRITSNPIFEDSALSARTFNATIVAANSSERFADGDAIDLTFIGEAEAVEPWALIGSPLAIPPDKLINAPTGGGSTYRTLINDAGTVPNLTEWQQIPVTGSGTINGDLLIGYPRGGQRRLLRRDEYILLTNNVEPTGTVAQAFSNALVLMLDMANPHSPMDRAQLAVAFRTANDFVTLQSVYIRGVGSSTALPGATAMFGNPSEFGGFRVIEVS